MFYEWYDSRHCDYIDCTVGSIPAHYKLLSAFTLNMYEIMFLPYLYKTDLQKNVLSSEK